MSPLQYLNLFKTNAQPIWIKFSYRLKIWEQTQEIVFLSETILFEKPVPDKKGLSYIGSAIWYRIPEIFKKTRNLNTFKHKMKHYYLNDLSNPNLWNVGRFDYALAIIKNIFLFMKQIFLHPFFSFSCFTLIEGPQWK